MSTEYQIQMNKKKKDKNYWFMLGFLWLHTGGWRLSLRIRDVLNQPCVSASDHPIQVIPVFLYPARPPVIHIDGRKATVSLEILQKSLFLRGFIYNVFYFHFFFFTHRFQLTYCRSKKHSLFS